MDTLEIEFELEKLKDHDIAETVKAIIGVTFALLALLDADDSNMDGLVNKFNVVVTETANETLGKYKHKKTALGCTRHLPSMGQTQ